MSHQHALPDVIYIIRHGEKPRDLAHKRAVDEHASGEHGAAEHSAAEHRGVDFHGNQNEHSLLPRGWQRSGALAALFDPSREPLRAGLRTPSLLVSPSYGDKHHNARHRTHQTVSGISERLGIAIAAEFAKGQEEKLASALTKLGPGAVLVCWDHTHIPALASALPLDTGTVIPQRWPDDRYDVIWAFTLATRERYTFAQVPQLLLPGDTDTVITDG
jgi:hypothetical protein